VCNDVHEKFKQNSRTFVPFSVSTALHFFSRVTYLSAILKQRNNVLKTINVENKNYVNQILDP